MTYSFRQTRCIFTIFKEVSVEAPALPVCRIKLSFLSLSLFSHSHLSPPFPFPHLFLPLSSFHPSISLPLCLPRLFYPPLPPPSLFTPSLSIPILFFPSYLVPPPPSARLISLSPFPPIPFFFSFFPLFFSTFISVVIRFFRYPGSLPSIPLAPPLFIYVSHLLLSVSTPCVPPPLPLFYVFIPVFAIL